MRRVLFAIAFAAACGGSPAPDGTHDAGVPDPDAPSTDAPSTDAPPDPLPNISVTDLEPQMGPAAGGNVVTLHGAGFEAGATTASLGASPLVDVTVTPPAELQGTAPAGAGFSDATVKLGAATAVLPRAYYHGAWATVGPAGGFVRDLVTAGSTMVYAATDDGGVYKSLDSGVTWSRAAAGLTSGDVHGLAVDPTNPARVFAATPDGVFVTTSAGELWTQTGPLPFGSARAVAITPGVPDRIFALSGSRICRSTDVGATWTQVHTVSSPADIEISPADPSVIYVSTDSGLGVGVIKSADGGTTWSLANTGIGDPQVDSIAVDPGNASIIYAASIFKIYKSTNGGASWSNTGFNLQFAPARLVVDPAGKVYVGGFDARVATSADGGATWTEISTGINTHITANVNCIAVRASAPAELHIGVGGWGIYRTTTAGASWAKSDAGLHLASIPFLATSPTTPGTAFALGVGDALWKTTNHGTTWTNAWKVSDFFASPESVGFHPTQTGYLLAGTTGSGVFYTTNGGQTWTKTTQGISGVAVQRFLFDPDLPSRVYAAGGQQGLYRSLDTGLTWQRFFDPSGTIEVKAIVKRGPAVLMASGRLYRSLDDGTTWAPFGTGLPAPVTDLQVDPQDPAGVYALAAGRVHRSTDGGATWTALTPQATRVTAFAIDPTRPATVYLASDQGPSVLRSLTGLATVVPFDAGLPPGVGLTLAVDKAGGTVYLGTPASGLRRLGN